MLKIKIFNKVISVDKKRGKFVINAEFKESEHPRDKDGKFTDGSGSSGGGKSETKMKKVNIKDLKTLEETSKSYHLKLPSGGDFWIRKNKVDSDGNLEIRDNDENKDIKKQEVTKKEIAKKDADKQDVNKEILTYSKTAPDGYELKINDLYKDEITELKKKQDSGVGKNLYGKDIDEFANSQYKADRIKEFEKADNVYDLTYGQFEDLDDINEAIEENPGDNEFDNREKPFVSEKEAIDFLREKRIAEEKEKNYDIDDLDLDEEAWEQIRRDFDNPRVRMAFFDNYTNVISGILEDNGFYTTTNSSRISDSSYIDVYKSDKDLEDGIDAFAKIRISDHDTHRFYGHHINLYTTENVYKEINKLLRSFANADFGIKETVYNKAIEVL